MTRPRIERVPADYEPGYPHELDEARYRELIAPDQRRRILRAAATAASLSLGASLSLQEGLRAQEGRPRPGAEPEVVRLRAEAVLRVLSKADSRNGMWFQNTTFQRVKDAQGNLQVIPRIPISFGNSHTGVFDAGRARELVRELFVAYGLKPEVDYRVREKGVAATLDVYDKALQIGTKLSGLRPKKNGMFAQPEREPPQRELDAEEYAELTRRGVRVHRAALESYPRMDGDEFTPMVAYLAAIVTFLNEATAGPDIDLSQILDNHRVRTELPAPAAATGVTVTQDQHFTVLTTGDADAEVAFELDRGTNYEVLQRPAGGRPAMEWRRLEDAPGPGGIRLLQLHGANAAGLRIEQDGAPPVRIEAPGLSAFVPARFSPRRPFRLTVKVPANTRCHLQPHLLLIGTR